MRRLLLALPLVFASAAFGQNALQPAGAETKGIEPEIVRVERIDGPDGVSRFRVWPPEVAGMVAESLSVPMDRIIIQPPLDAPAAQPVAKPAARTRNSEDTPETVLWNDYSQVLLERGIGRGEEIGGIAAIGVRLGGKGQASELREVDEEVRASVEAWNERGALVISVVPGGPADLSGFEPGDVIVQAGPFWIDTPASLIRMASRADVGAELELLVLRRGQVERMWVTPIDRKKLEELQR